MIQINKGPIMVATLTLLAQTSSGTIITEDFEDRAPGSFPGDPWQDISVRGVTNPATDPSMFVINTIDAQGNQTRALQSSGANGTNGFYADIDHARHHSVVMDVRVDRLADPGEGWPAGMGYMQDTGADDVNGDPQGLIYAWTDRRWRLFIAQGPNRPAADLLITTSRFEIGTWYRLSLSVDTLTGTFEAGIADAATGAAIGSLTHTFANWDPTLGRYDAVGMFDGELPNTDSFGRASFDNINYVPSPAGGTVLLGAFAVTARRRRPTTG